MYERLKVRECETPCRRADTVRKQKILNTYHGFVNIGIPGKLISERVRRENEFGRNAGTIVAKESKLMTESHNPVRKEEKLVRLKKTW